jgi:hypothetical protein
MEDQKVSFETAVLAKEKGFDAKTAHVFIEWGDKYKAKLIRQESQRKKYLPAPTQSLLQCWLREVHNIDVQPYLIRTQLNGEDMLQSINQKEYSFQLFVKGVSQFVKTKENLSFEQALEEGLKEGLNLIK